MCIRDSHHPEYSRLHMIKRVARHLIGQMLHLRVKDQELTMKGVEDFCKGTEFLRELDPTKLHPEIMKMGYAMQDVSDDLHKFGVDVEKTKPQPSHLYEDGGFAKKHLLLSLIHISSPPCIDNNFPSMVKLLYLCMTDSLGGGWLS